MRIRPVAPGDAASLAAVYAPYVAETAITFELEAPDADEFARRVASVSQTHPYVVAEDDEGRVIGYAYASAFRARPAYARTAESTVYLAKDARGRGVGRALMDDLLGRLRAGGFHRVVAGIALPNEASVRLHESLGFKKVAHFTEVGRKFDRWWDVAFWERGF